MTDILNALHAGLRRLPSVVGMDTALFQSADSYFEGSAGRRDPLAVSCFEAVTTPFCNNARLVIPVSGGTRIEVPTKLIEWWGPNRETTRSHDWRDKAAKYRLAEPVAAFVETFPTQVAGWISFQLSPGLRDQNFGHPEQQDLLDVETNAQRLIQEHRIPNLTSALDKEAAAQRWDVPSRYNGPPQRMLLTAVAYAFSLYVRAWSYAWTLGDHIDDPYYRCIWIRDSALNSNVAFGTQREDTPRPEWFPWGEILTRIFGETHDDSARIRTALTAIRDQSDVFFQQYRELLDGRNPRRTRDERELLVATVLQNADATPKLTRRAQVQRLATFLRGMVSFVKGPAVPVLAGAYEVIAQIPPDWIDRAEGALALRFRR